MEEKDLKIKFRGRGGITLIAMVITIIVLLILAGISIATLAGENGLINRTTKAKESTRAGEIKDLLRIEATNNKAAEYQNEKQKTRNEFITELATDGKLTPEEVAEIQSAENPVITIGGITIDFSILPESVQVWTQNKTTVTNGKISLEVGTKVTGYSVTGYESLEWYVLGAKDGNLLITTNTCPEEVSLSGNVNFQNADGTYPWVETLKTVAEKYTNPDFAEGKARTIDVEDINRVTGYQTNNEGVEVIYKLKASSSDPDKKVVWYTEDANQDGTESSETSFEYWNGSSWIKLGDGESTTLEGTYVFYKASSIDSNAKTLLFTNTGYYSEDTGSYWLGSPYVDCGEGYASWGLLCVFSSYISGNNLFRSVDGPDSYSMGLRPVVSLKSSVKVTETGVVSK